MQHKAVYLLFHKFTLHVSGVNHTHHQEYTSGTGHIFVQLPPSTNFCAATSFHKNMTSTGGCSYNFVYS